MIQLKPEKTAKKEKKEKPKKATPVPKAEKTAKPPPAPKVVVPRVGRPKGPEMTPILLNLPPELIIKIEAYWHKEELGSKSEAIRVLIERGLGGALLERSGK